MSVLDLTKKTIWKFGLARTLVAKVYYKFLCIITPVFDPALDSLHKLIPEIQSQTFERFIQVLISNGPSPRIKDYVRQLNLLDPRIIYDEIEMEDVSKPEDLLINLGKRRNYCLKKYNAERYIFLDADAKLIDNQYFSKLYKAHREINRDVLITLTRILSYNNYITLPVFPIELGHIDIANFSFSKRIAKNYSYPTDYDPCSGIGNDYRFFAKFANEDNTAILNYLSVIRDGNNSYKRVTELFNL